MNGWLEEGQSFSGGGWGGTATATPEGGWMQEGSSFAEPLEQPEPVTPPEPAAPDYATLVEQRMATTQNQLNFVEDAIRYGLETGDFDESYLERREKLRNRMTRLRGQQQQLATGIQLTPIDGTGLEGEFDVNWGDEGPVFLQDLDPQERSYYQSSLENARTAEAEGSNPVGRVARRIGMGLANSLSQAAHRYVGDYEGARQSYLQGTAETQAVAEQGGRVENIVAGAGESIAKAVPAGMAGGLPGILAAFFADTYMQSYESGKSRDLGDDEARVYAATSATVEAATTIAFSVAGAGGFEKLVARATRGRARNAAAKAAPGIVRMLTGIRDKLPTLLSEIGGELAEENIVSQFQYNLDNATFGGEWSLAEAADIAIDTTASTILAVGAMRTADPKVRAAIGKFVQEPSRANAKAVGLDYLGKKEQREKVASTVRSMALREQLQSMVGTTFQTAEEADYIYEMLEARARSADVTLEEYLERTGLEFESAKWDEFVAKKGGAKSTALETMAESSPDNESLARKRGDWEAVADSAADPDWDVSTDTGFWPDTEQIPRVNTRTTIRKTLDEVDFEDPESVKGAIDKIADLEGELKVQAELRRGREASRGKVRGADAIRARLLDARRRGELREDSVEVADWLIRQNPAAFEDVGVSIRKQPMQRLGGHYDTAERIVTLFKTSDPNSANTAAHELIHSLERFVPEKLATDMNRGWLSEVKRVLDDAMKTDDRNKYEIAVDLLRRSYGLDPLHIRQVEVDTAFAKVIGSAPSDMLDMRAAEAGLYYLTSPSEFWAVRGSKLAAEKSEAKTVFQQFRQWLRELIARIKSSLGTGADNAVIKSLNRILRGNAEEVQGFRNNYGDATDLGVVLNRFDLERQWIYRQQLNDQVQGESTLAEESGATGAAERLRGTKVVNQDGTPKTLYHGTATPDFASWAREELRGAEKARRDKEKYDRDLAEFKKATAARYDEIYKETRELRKEQIREEGRGRASNEKRLAELRLQIKSLEDELKSLDAKKPKKTAAMLNYGESRMTAERIAELEQIDTGRYGANDSGWWSAGAYFTEDPAEASDYGSGGGVFRVSLNLQNPYNRDNPVGDVERAINERFAANTRDRRGIDYERARSQARREVLSEFGYDGEYGAGQVRPDGTTPLHYVAFRNDQIVYVPSGAANAGPLAERETSKTKANRAQIEFLKNEGRTVITAFEQADLASMVHELGHLFRRDLAGTDLKAAENWAGVKKGRWSRASEEKFADGFLKWAAEGKGPSEAVTRFFQRFSDYLKSLFDAHRKSRLAPLNLTPEMQQVFGGLLKFDVQQAATPVETQGPERQRAPGEPEAYFQINTDPQVQQPQPGVTLAESNEPVSLRFRGLANHAVSEAARKLNYASTEEMGQYSQRKWVEAEAEAARRIQQDPAGRAADIERRVAEAMRTGGTINITNMVDTAELAMYRNAIADEAFAKNDVALMAKHNMLNRAFVSARTAQAQSLGYRDPVESPQGRARRAIQTALTTDPPDIARQRQDARTPEEHAKLDQQLIDHYNGVRERLKGIGIDLSDMDSIVSDPKKAATVIQAVKPREHGFFDMLFEYWRNSILSGITTHGVNTASNIGFMALNFAERLGEATFNAAYSVTGAKQPKIKSATFGEVGHLLAALNTTTLSKAISNAMMAWRTEMPQLEASLGRDGTVKIDGPLFAIAGDPTTTSGQALNKAGRLIRMMGYRPLLFMDELAKTVSSHMEAAAFAYRIAKAEAAKNPSVDVNSRIQQLLENTDSDAWTLALDKAQTLAFQGQKGIVAGGVSKVISGIRQAPGGRWIVPFRDTPAAVFEEGIRRMPVIGFLLDYAEQRRNKKTIGEIDFAPILARQAIALAAMGLVEGMLADDDEPFITGTRDMADQKQRDLAYRTFQPMSVRVPFTDMRISYARFEPMATALAWTVDTVQAYKQGAKQGGVADGMASATGEAATAMLRQIGTKTFLDTVGDLMEAFQDAQRHNRMERGLSWGAKQVASFVPNIYRSSIRGNDITQNKVWGKGEQWGQMLLKRTAQNALGSPAGFPPTPRYDIWGRQITFNSPNAGVLMRALSTIGTKTRLAEDVEEIDRALYVWNVRHPQQAIAWSEPQHYIRVNKETHYLTDDEYTEYARRAGEYALTNAKKIRINVGDPTLKQIENIGAAVQRGQQRARNELKPLWLKRIRAEQTPTPAR